MTFRTRTALVVVGLTAATLGGAFALVWARFASWQRDQLDRALVRLANNEAHQLATGGLVFSDAPGPSANAVGPLPKYGVVFAPDGRVVSTTPNLSADEARDLPRELPLETAFDFPYLGKPKRGVLVAVPGTDLVALVATSRADLEDDANMMASAMALALGAGCAWAGLVAFGVATRFTREHRIVGDVARRVAGGDLSARVSFQSSDTDLRQHADALNAMIDRLAGLLAVQERFVTHAAHELRTPLTSLRVELEHAIRTGRDRSDYDLALRGALESARRLTALADDLLALARLKATPPPQVSPVQQGLADAIADVVPIARQRQIQIVADPLPGRARGDRSCVARMFRNLLENAVRHSPDAGQVRVLGELRADCLLVSVVDQGPGVASGDVAHIFEPFSRGSQQEDTEGAGLGLAIARGLARSFGGDIAATAGPGGSFTITLPVVPGETAA
jgi:two-component system OmpR family sensor kinase